MKHSAQRTAVLVIDMQNDFCSPAGAMAALGADVQVNAAVAGRLPRFLDRARNAGCLVVWVRQAAHEQLVSPARRARAEAMGRSPLSVCAAGSWGAELAEGLRPEPGDCHLEKTRYSAFVGTPLHNLLRAHGRDHVVVVGTAANVCVDSTIRDAYMADLATTMPTDLVGWTRADLAEAAIRNLGFYFCETTTSAELLSDWSVVDRAA
ncbi:cysteine hydrolase [Micromonospora fiedleri]|uniref:Cysteine hydrolase n=1 Tax=Micromonospora fiedleri TaxID=1157498 RepID=A0ABS1ULM6_9ACTN|nr:MULTISPECIES: isochorismatase family cysteine hydrolase [Micromonospora]MBL6276261.1 cysteine hydrolase [Micromonospora fiedleri]WSK40558.1 cysteine hydrolase [Micromonospora maris]